MYVEAQHRGKRIEEYALAVLVIPLFLLIGISLGLLGGGGSIIAVPVLVYVAHVDAYRAIPMSLAIVGATSAGAAVQHWRAGNVSLRSALIFGAASIVGALGGAQFTHLVSRRALMLCFATVMIVVAVRMLTSRQQESAAGRPHVLVALAAGAVVGVLTGFLGVGGGFLIVPALIFFLRLPVKQAVGTSLLVIAMSAVGGLAGHLRTTAIDWNQTVVYTLVALLGTVAGVLIAGRMDARSLRKGFGLFVLAVGIAVAWMNV